MARKPKTIVQRIALDGGKEIEAEFKALGAAGEQAFAQLRKAVDSFNNVSPLAQRIAALKKQFNDLKPAAAAIGAGLATAAKAAVAAGASFTAAGGGLLYLAKSGTSAVDALNDTAQAVGISVQSLQALEGAAIQAGAGPEVLEKALVKINDDLALVAKSTEETQKKFGNSFEAAGGAIEALRSGAQQAYTVADGLTVRVVRFGEAAQKSLTSTKKASDEVQKTVAAYKELGVDITAIAKSGGNAETVFLKLADGFQKMDNGAQKTAAAIKFFGERIGPKLIPLLNGGSEAVATFRKQLDDMGLTLSDVGIEAAGKFEDSFDLLFFVLRGFRNKISTLFAPLGTQLLGGLLKVLSDNSKAIVSLAETLAQRAIPYLDAFLKLLAGDAVEDRGAGKQVRAWYTGVIAFKDALVNVFETVKSVFPKIAEFAGQVTDAINRIFGTNLTTGEVVLYAALLKLVGGFSLLSGAINFAIGLFGGLGIAGTLALTAIGAAIVLTILKWDEMKEAASNAWEGIKKAFSGDLSGAWAELTKTSALTWATIVLDATLAWAALTRIFGAAAASTLFKPLADAAAATFAGGGFAAVSAAAAPFVVLAGAIAGVTLALVEFQKAYATSRAEIENRAKPLTKQEMERVLALPDVEQMSTLEQLKATWEGLINLFGRAKSANPDDILPDTGAAGNAVKSLDDVTGAVKRLGDTIKDVPRLPALDNVLQGQTGGDIGGGAGNDTLGTGNDQTIKVGGDFSAFLDGAREAFATVQQIATEAFAAVTQTAASAWVQIGADAQAAFDVITQAGRALGEAIAQFGEQGFAAVSSAASATADAVKAAADAMVAAMERVIAAAQAAAQAASDAASSVSSSGGGGDQQFATGGYVSGPGTGTSDSIMARLSNGEFVMRAAAVRKYGIDLFARLNGLRMTIPRLRDGLPGFAFGGPVGRFAVPALASASSGGATRSLYITLDGQQIGPMFSDEAVYAAWTRVASRRSVSRMTPKPGWVGG